MGIIKAFEGKYIYKRGYPLVIVTSFEQTSGEGVRAEVLILFENYPHSQFTFEPHIISNYNSPASLAEAGITNAVEFVADEARLWAQRYLENEQFKIFVQDGGTKALGEVDLKEVVPWQDALARRRLRGLSEQVIQQMLRTESTELFEFLRILPLRYRPIVVRSLPPSGVA